MSYAYLSDKDFLKEVDCARIKTMYVKLTALDWDENVIQDIQSSVVSGTLNIDGKSAMRRACSLSIKTDDVNVTDLDNLFSLNKKVKLEIGYKNTFKKYTEYPIIWFPQGIFVIISASISQSTGGVSLSIQLKDKMCLLNGECGGVIPFPIEIDVYDDIDEDGSLVTKKITIYKLIQELVNHYGKEPLHKILISDIDNRVKKVLSWSGDSALYGEINNTTNSVYNFTTIQPTSGSYITYTSGDDIGYSYEDFYYPDTLSVNAGDNVCTVLEKIKSALGNFEYFYDVEGNFIFREIKNYLNTSKVTSEIKDGKWKVNIGNENYLMDISNDKSVYSFDNTNIITSCSNNPQYNMIKNDFIVCGKRKNTSGNEIPIFYHLAIDKKPLTNITFKGFEYEDPDDGLVKFICPTEYNQLPTRGEQGLYYKLADGDEVYIWTTVGEGSSAHFGYKEIDVELQTLTSKDWRTTLYLQGSQSTKFGLPQNDYYEELKNEWPKIYDVTAQDYSDDIKNLNKLNFFLDFLDMNTNIAKFSVSNIGKRTKVVNDSKINCLFEQDIPDLFVIETGTSHTDVDREECIQRSDNYVQVSQDIYSNISNGGKMNSAFNRIQELLYQYTDYNETISLQTLPIYYLEPNSRITVNNTTANISGDYVISSLSVPLNVGGNMTISATKMVGPLEGVMTGGDEPTPGPTRVAGVYNYDTGALLKTLTLDEVGTDCSNFRNIAYAEDGFDSQPVLIVLPEGVTSTTSDAFGNNYASKLNTISVNFPKTLTKINSNTFYYYNKALKTVSFEEECECTVIESEAFKYCDELTNIDLSNTKVETIGYSCFSGCPKLTNVVLPNTLKKLDTYVFATTPMLKEITLPQSLETIESNAFYRSGIKKLSIPGGVTVKSGLLSGASNLEELTFEEGITSIPGYNFIDRSFSIKKLSLPGTLTTVPEYLAFGVNSLEEIILNNGITEIGRDAFDSCVNIKNISIPNSITKINLQAFMGCSNIEEITLSNNLIEIGSFAFSNCTKVETITIPNNVTTIGNNAFQNVKHITYYGSAEGAPWGALSMTPEIKKAAGLYDENDVLIKSWDELISENYLKLSDYNNKKYISNFNLFFNGKLVIKDDIDAISYQAFNDSDLSSIEMPDSITEIGVEAFLNCGDLTNVTMSKNIKIIDDSAFYNCERLESIALPEGLTKIGQWAFNDCTALGPTLTIPGTVNTIGYNAFGDCQGLESIILKPGIKIIGDFAFQGCSGLKTITIPNTVTTIGESAFQYCIQLNSITIPNSVTKIGDSAFYECTSLTYIEIPNSISQIDGCVFYNCTDLASVTIPDSVTEIGESAFYGCTSLTSVTIPDSVTEIGDLAFEDVQHIEYYGDAEGEPWGALSMN